MEKPMFICRRDAEGYHTVMEVNDTNLDSFLAMVAKPGSQASRDASLMTLANGSELPSRLNPGQVWFRVNEPIRFTPTPTHCNLTSAPLGDVAYDAKTRYGGRCIMSEQSWKEHGCGRLGTGFGQKFLRGSDGNFYLSEGSTIRPKPYRVAA